MMRKTRVFSIALVTMMIAGSIMPVCAADPMPLAEYAEKGWDVYSHPSFNELNRGVTEDGCFFKGTVEYEAYPKEGPKEVKQTAHITWLMPSDFPGYMEDGKENETIHQKSEAFNEEYEYSDRWDTDKGMNNTLYFIKHDLDLNRVGMVKVYPNESLEKVFDKCLESVKAFFSDYSDPEKNQTPNGFTVERDETSMFIIAHKTDNYFIEQENETKYEGVKHGYKEKFEDDYHFIRYFTLPELPNVILYAEYESLSWVFATVFDKDHKEYEPYYEEYKKKRQEFLDRDFGRDVLFDMSRISITWDDAEVTYGNTEEETEPKEEITEAVTEEVHESATVIASKEEGESKGVPVPVIIVIGVAAAGGGAALALKKKSDNEKKKNKTYKMYTQKDFGDFLIKGGEPVKVRARMAEVEGVKERDREDLTAKISGVGEGARVEKMEISGRYVEASVTVPKDYEGDEASVLFTFTGEGGTFTEKVIFRVSDGPYLEFVSDDNDGYISPKNCIRFDAIKGDGFTYSAKFKICDAVKEPDLWAFKEEYKDGLSVKFEKTDEKFVYKVSVKNKTSKAMEHDIFAEPEDLGFDFTALIEEAKTRVSGNVSLRLYEEGLTVASRYKDKKDDTEYIRVQAYEKEHAGDLDNKWQVTEITFTLALIGDTKSEIDPDGMSLKFEKLKGAGGIGCDASAEQSLAEKFEYKEELNVFNDKNVLTFEPNSNLCEPEDGSYFIVLLPAKCSCKGKTYEGDIPLRLEGKKPDPFEGWDEEYSKLKERIEKYTGLQSWMSLRSIPKLPQSSFVLQVSSLCAITCVTGP